IINCPPCDITPDFTVLHAHGDCKFRKFISNPTTAGSGTTITGYSWEITNSMGTVIGTSSAGNYTFIFPANGTYTVCLTVTGVGPGGDTCSVEHCEQVIINCPPCEVNPDFIGLPAFNNCKKR